jgi:hypothetical protein
MIASSTLSTSADLVEGHVRVIVDPALGGLPGRSSGAPVKIPTEPSSILTGQFTVS